MAESNITCSGLIATGGVGQIALRWTVTDPNARGLPYLALDTVELWAATENDRSGAVKAAEGLTSALHAGVPEEESRFYWVRARNRSGLFGDWFPSSATGGISGTSTTATKLRAAEIVGGRFLTSESFPRVEIRSDLVQVRILDADGRLSAIFGPGGDISDALVTASSYGNFPAGIFAGLAAGAGLQATANANVAVAAAGFSAHYPAVQAFNNAGNFAFYAPAGGYGPFTGAHDGLLRSDTQAEVGDVLVDLRVVARGDISNALTEVGVADQTSQRGVIGVLASRRPANSEMGFAVAGLGDLTGFDRVVINGVGEGQINVCDAGGPIEAGDLLVASSIRGKAMRQADDIVRSTTVARAREASGGRAQIACVYLAG